MIKAHILRLICPSLGVNYSHRKLIGPEQGGGETRDVFASSVYKPSAQFQREARSIHWLDPMTGV